MPDTNLTAAVPVLPVDDLQTALEYYGESLGFPVSWMHGEPPHYAAVTRDNAMIHLSEREDTRIPIVPVSVYVVVRDVDALYEEYRKRGLDIFDPPQDQDNRMREFDVRDASGHYLTFGQAI